MRRIYTHQWETYWEDLHIVVRIWIDSIFRGGEDVFVDGIKIPSSQREPWRPRRSSDLRHTLNAKGKERELHVHVGPLLTTPPGRGDNTGCLILVDGVPIGGDTEDGFKTIEFTAAPDNDSITTFKDLVEEAGEQPQPPERLPWWVWVYSWVVTHRLRTLLVLGFVAYIVWEATFGD